MKPVQLTMFFVLYALISAMIVNADSGTEEPDFPTFTIPTYSFIDLTGGCGGFTDCIEYVGAVIYNLGLTIIAVVDLTFEMVSYTVNLLTVITSLMIAGVTGAPSWLNMLIGTYFAVNVGIMIYRMARKGDDEA